MKDERETLEAVIQARNAAMAELSEAAGLCRNIGLPVITAFAVLNISKYLTYTKKGISHNNCN